VALIPARGGSKGIPKKNIINFCGKPLIQWSIEAALGSNYIKDVYVSSDNRAILKISESAGAKTIVRPKILATNISSTEEALLHAIKEIEKKYPIDIVVFLQATSPLRTSDDIDLALKEFLKNKTDSLFSASILHDPCIWIYKNKKFDSLTYDYKNRKRRQERKPLYLENGSIYIFKPRIIKLRGNRLGGKISVYLMPFWKSYEIDKPEDFEVCEYYMKRYLSKLYLLAREDV
jgi:N-acylneuraminate cytidylyltransferase